MLAVSTLAVVYGSIASRRRRLGVGQKFVHKTMIKLTTGWLNLVIKMFFVDVLWFPRIKKSQRKYKKTEISRIAWTFLEMTNLCNSLLHLF